MAKEVATKGSFGAIVKICENLKAQGAGLWSAVVLFAVTNCADAIKAAPSENPQGKTLREAFKDREQEVKKSHDGLVMNTIGAYRSAKSVVSAAARYGVALIGKDGNPLGKTEVEEGIKALREKARAVDTIDRACTMATNAIKDGEFTKPEMYRAVAAVNALRERIVGKASEVLGVKEDKVITEAAKHKEEPKAA